MVRLEDSQATVNVYHI